MIQALTSYGNRRRRLWSLSLLIIVSSMILPTALLVHPARGDGAVLINPAHIEPQPVGNTVIYTVRVASMDTFNAWDIQVQTGSVLNATSLSIAGNVLGDSPLFVGRNCVNGGQGIPLGDPGNIGCDVTDGPGFVHSAAAFRNSAPAGTSGLLFTINFKVQSGVYTQVTPLNDQIVDTGVPVSHTTTPGDYGVAPGKIPIAEFTWKPLNPHAGDLITFNATLSSDPNPGHRIVSYTWDFADHSKIEPITRPLINHTFSGGASALTANFPVTLTVTDDLNPPLSGRIQHVVAITNLPFHDIAVQSVDVSQEDSILSGTPVIITVVVFNHGTFDEKGFNLTLSVENRILWRPVNYTNGFSQDQKIRQGPFQWNTTGEPIGVYEIKAELMPLRASNGTILETDSSPCPTKTCFSNNVGYHIVRISVPHGVSLVSLSMVQSVGLVVGVLVATGAAWSIIGGRTEKRKRQAAEALP